MCIRDRDNTAEISADHLHRDNTAEISADHLHWDNTAEISADHLHWDNTAEISADHLHLDNTAEISADHLHWDNTAENGSRITTREQIKRHSSRQLAKHAKLYSDLLQPLQHNLFQLTCYSPVTGSYGAPRHVGRVCQ